MKKSNKFSPEVRERAVRMVQEHKGEYPSLWAAVESIAPKIGCVPQTLLEWVKRAGISPVRPPRWRPDLNQAASTNPGAVQSSTGEWMGKSLNVFAGGGREPIFRMRGFRLVRS